MQARLAETFQRSGSFSGVGKPGEGLAIDYQVLTEVRAFEVEVDGGERAEIELYVKLLNDRNGVVRASRTFEANARFQAPATTPMSTPSTARLARRRSNRPLDEFGDLTAAGQCSSLGRREYLLRLAQALQRKCPKLLGVKPRRGDEIGGQQDGRPRSRHSPSMRAARLTAGPMTVKSSRFSPPILPYMTSPTCNAMP